ncbi:hypothetical protein EEDFHM_04069 [Methylorubrum populi]
MSLIIRWTKEEDRAALIGTEFNQHQVMEVFGSGEQEFYDWMLEGNLAVTMQRLHLWVRQAPSVTYVMFPYEFKRPEHVEATNDAYTRIKLAWKPRDGVQWEADGFVKCVQG